MKTISKLLPLFAGAIVVSQIARNLRRIDLRNKVVLITGGSRGLGLAMAQEFAKSGAQLVICARNPIELEQAEQTLGRRGSRVLAIPCDVQQRDQVQSMIDTIIRQMGRLDVVVNNAGIIQVGPFESMNEDDFARAMDINYWGILHTTFASLSHLKPGSRIVNITSIGGTVPIPHLLPYTASKFAAVGFSLGLRSELKKRRVDVVTVVPGLMRTGSYIHAMFKGDQPKEYQWFPKAPQIP